jgi:hypothetical protein
MVQSVDYLYTLATERASQDLDGMACSFFESGVSADVAEVVGTTVFPLSDLVSH